MAYSMNGKSLRRIEFVRSRSMPGLLISKRAVFRGLRWIQNAIFSRLLLDRIFVRDNLTNRLHFGDEINDDERSKSF